MRKLSTDIGRGKQDFNQTKRQIRKRDHRGATVGTKYQQTQSTNHFFMEKRPAVQSAGREETGQTFPEIDIPKEKLSVSPLYIELLNKPDNFYAVNAFSLTWTNASHYIFPPFSMLGAVLQKIRLDQARATLIAPLFTTQPWFPQKLQPIYDHCYILPKMDNLLSIPNKKQKHPLKSMKMGVFQDIRRHLRSHGIPEKAASVIIASWRNSTKKQYGSYLKKWL